MRGLRKTLVVAGACALLPTALAAQAAPASYTAAQAEAGAEAYQAHCAECHMADLSGGDEAPPLTGGYFASSWGGSPVRQLLQFVRENMPLTRPGSLDEQTYVALVAYLLSRSGAPAGETPLAPEAEGVVAPTR